MYNSEKGKKPVSSWIITVICIAYLLSPFDILPVNLTDDLIVLFIGVILKIYLGSMSLSD